MIKFHKESLFQTAAAKPHNNTEVIKNTISNNSITLLFDFEVDRATFLLHVLLVERRELGYDTSKLCQWDNATPHEFVLSNERLAKYHLHKSSES